MKLQRMNKATVGAIAAAGVGLASHHLGLEWDIGLQALIVTGVTGFVVWIVPNKEEEQCRS